ncbi:hypothetical protein [Embleya sp. AB8]
MIPATRDFDGDGKADLWARAANGNVYTFAGGKTPDANGIAGS